MMPNEDELEEFLENAGIQPAIESEPKIRPNTKDFQGAKIENIEVKSETVQRSTIRLMKVHTITRTPDQKIAAFDLTNSAGRDFHLTIDEATARAIAAIFD